jgi:hemerythrin
MNVKQLPFEPMNEIHNNEVVLLETLLSAIKNKENLNDIFELFVQDVKEHFAFEENLMEKYNFFAIVPHKMEHNRILKELEELKQKLDDYEFLDNYFNNIFLVWLDNHINTIDTVTAGYFDMIGIK